MERRIYQDVYGEPLDESDFNKHHIFARCTAKGKGKKAHDFINQRGLVLPMVVGVHKELHANVDFPPLPSITLIHRMSEITGYMRESNPYERFIQIADHFDSLARNCPNTDHRRQCERIADNLAQQAPFVLLGQVQIIQQEAA